MALRSLAQAELVLNSMLTQILIVDNNLAICYLNAAAQQLLAQSSRKLVGTNFSELFSSLSLDVDLLQSTLQQEQGFTDNEVELIIHNQRYIFSVTAQRLSEERILIEMMPLDNQKKLSQEQLQQAQQLAARELVRGLAHEIKNPLGGLRGAAQLLGKALTDPALQEYTEMIMAQADRLRNLVDRLLGPQQPSRRIKQNLHIAIEQVYQLLRIEKPHNIELIRDYDPSLPELIHDPEQIEQVVLNIARNALQALAANGGKITIRTRTAFQVTLHATRYRLCARIDIEDDGPGIALALQDTLFYPMVSGREGGNGLGLSIARSLIDQHQGKIEFSSWPGHTLFSVYLPIQE